ncbi:MAG: isoamylase early set domain-containing protein [Gemmatimonadota bacterium]|nr:isoamylase early set domain-containing protein [Gemmatimonadota bacterium]
MTESERDPYIEWIARQGRRPVELSSEARGRLMDAVRATPLPARRRRGLGWLTSPRPLSLSPLTSTLLAAGLVGIGAVVGLGVTHRDGRSPAEQPAAVAANSQLPVHDSLQVHRFELAAPGAVGVALVGDFNAWNASATPMERTADGKAWTVTVKLPTGRHVYAFVVDGAGGASKWVPDPAALRAPDDGFGTPNSVVLVGQRGAT